MINTLEQEVEEKRWQTAQLGPFDTCYMMARERGYEVIDRVEKGIKLHVPSSSDWATITQVNSTKSWEFVRYNYYPADDEPRFDRSNRN